MKRLIVGTLGAAAVAGAIALAAPAQADAVSICGPGYGVSGNHTSCAFAANIRAGYQASGGMQHFVAYSPATGDQYYVDCETTYINFASGGSAYAQQCYAGDNAEAVVW